MVISSTVDGFRATVNSLLTLDGEKVVIFHNYLLLEDRCWSKTFAGGCLTESFKGSSNP
jgi:hypothetical protein